MTTRLAGAIGLLFMLAGCNSTEVLTPPAEVGDGSQPATYSQQLASPAVGTQPVQSAPLGQPGGYAEPVRGPQNSLEAQAAALAQGGRNPVASAPLEGADTQAFPAAPQQTAAQQPASQSQPAPQQAQSQQAALPPAAQATGSAGDEKSGDHGVWPWWSKRAGRAFNCRTCAAGFLADAAASQSRLRAGRAAK